MLAVRVNQRSSTTNRRCRRLRDLRIIRRTSRSRATDQNDAAAYPLLTRANYPRTNVDDYSVKYGAPERIRTSDLCLRRPGVIPSEIATRIATERPSMSEDEPGCTLDPSNQKRQ
jgi:hypothetical protein